MSLTRVEAKDASSDCCDLILDFNLGFLRLNCGPESIFEVSYCNWAQNGVNMLHTTYSILPVVPDVGTVDKEHKLCSTNLTLSYKQLTTLTVTSI